MKSRNRTHKTLMIALCYGSGRKRLARQYGWRRVKVAWKELLPQWMEEAGDIGYALS